MILKLLWLFTYGKDFDLLCLSGSEKATWESLIKLHMYWNDFHTGENSDTTHPTPQTKQSKVKQTKQKQN